MTTTTQLDALKQLATGQYTISSDLCRFEGNASPVKLATAKSLHDKGLVVCSPAPDHDPRRAAFKTRWSRGTTMTITQKGEAEIADAAKAATICNANDGGLLRSVLEEASKALWTEICNAYNDSAIGVRSAFEKAVRIGEEKDVKRRHYWNGNTTSASDRELHALATGRDLWNANYARHDRGTKAGYNDDRKYVRRPATDAEIAHDANKWADAAIEGFIGKMLKKFGGFGEVTECTFLGGLSYNAIRIRYASGLSFTVRNKIVLKLSPKGNLFNQYPCTFHDVCVNGVARKNAASERAVKNIVVELQG